MSIVCPRCTNSNPDEARFCRHCGLPLELGPTGVLGAGRAPHPEPLRPPAAAQEIEDAANLYFIWQSASGGAPLLGTEALELTAFNGGHALADVVLRVRGSDKAGVALFALEREIASWPHGQSVRLEIPSWEIPGPVHTLSVELLTAEFGVLEQ